MRIEETNIKGLFVIEPEFKSDERGSFARIFCVSELKDYDLSFTMVQANTSFTKKKNTIRGMHFQIEPKAEVKIVSCLKGAVYDVAVDLRKDSETYGKWEALELNEENRKMFFIPAGFAHGFQTLRDDCELLYFMSEFYSPDHARGMRWDDPKIGIVWPLANPILSKQDKAWSLIST